ncbi:hypothetical protein F5Y18DRAFT_93432 [Xylariaceae sp. FL1019]|nr:hypothetical protein F5Y18DRAFT_93432 [Xylariaceae sp. FL1019]
MFTMLSTRDDPAPPLDDVDRGPALRSYIIVLLVITFIAISLRFWSRSLGSPSSSSSMRRGRFWWDDWVALSSVPFIVTEFALIFYMLSLGLGRHANTLSAEQIAGNLATIYVVYFIYDTALFLTKLSALLFLGRVFPSYANQAWFNWALWTIHGFNVSWLLGIVFGTLFMCNPVAKGYDPNITGHCNDIGALWLGSAIPSVVIDLIILLLPLPKVWALQMSGARKIGITIAFVLGYIVIIVSLGRLITVVKSEAELASDLTFIGVPALYWLCSEAPITLSSICVPALLPLWRHLYAYYFTPLGSRVSRLTHSNTGSYPAIRSRTGVFSKSLDGNTPFDRRGDHTVAPYHMSSLGENASNHSRESQQRFMGVPLSHQQYKAQVHRADFEGQPLSVPEQSIYVAKTVEVNRERGGSAESSTDV